MPAPSGLGACVMSVSCAARFAAASSTAQNLGRATRPLRGRDSSWVFMGRAGKRSRLHMPNESPAAAVMRNPYGPHRPPLAALVHAVPARGNAPQQEPWGGVRAKVVAQEPRSMGKTIRCYDYVNHRYEAVRDALVADPVALFRAATKSASSRAEAVAVALRVDVAGVEVSKDVVVAVKRVAEEPGKAKKPQRTLLELE